MQIRYPAPLVAGARIAVTAPSSGVAERLHPRLDLVLAHLRAQGFVVEEGRCLRREVRSASAPADERAAELVQFLLRGDVHAIIPPWGGELAIELLDRIDWSALEGATPKWVLGYSDTSTWMLPLSLRLGWATAHGPCLMDLAPGQADPLTSRAMRALATPPGGVFEQRQSERWQLEWTDFVHDPATTYQLTEPTRWTCLNRPAEAPVEFAGRLVGGCLDTLMHTAGTPHGDVRRFIDEAGRDGSILYFENAEQSPVAVARALHRLRWAGWLDGLAGVLVGRSAVPDATDPSELRYAEALASGLGALPCPVLVDVDIGHRPPQVVLINGALACVHLDPVRGGSVSQRLV